MSIETIKQILLELSDNNLDFPIRDIVDIIMEYVYETPTRCIDSFGIENLSVENNYAFIYEYNNILIKFMPKYSFLDVYNCDKILINRLDKQNNLASQPLIKLTNHHIRTYTFKYDNSVLTIKAYTRGGFIINTICSDDEKMCQEYDDFVKYWDKEYPDLALSRFIKTEKGFIVGCEDGQLGIYENNKMRLIQAHDNVVYNLLELRNGNILSASTDRNIVIWGRRALIPIVVIPGIAYTNFVELKNGDIAFGTKQYNIVIYDRSIKNIKQILQGHEIFVCHITELKNRCIASVSRDGVIKIWG